MDKKIPSEGAAVPREVERAMNRGERQRYALGTQGLKGEKK